MNHNGLTGAKFVAELFLRSQLHMTRYANTQEGFYIPGHRPQRQHPPQFANHLVDLLGNNQMRFGNPDLAFTFVDYEISPIRTTRSCWENGKNATSSGAGGMDLLLMTVENGERPALPAIGEIKATTESVGPTFALLQSLTYAAELVTHPQWQRLGTHFPPLQQICEVNQQPRVDLFLILQEPANANMDLDFAQQLAHQLTDTDVNEYVRRIIFLSCGIENEIAHFQQV